MTSSASARGWGRGWPQDNSSKMVTVHAGGVRLDVHRDIADLIAYLLTETVRRGYRLDQVRDDWGFANRPIRGSRTPSNHSWGLAVDLNATRNPMQRRLKTDMPVWLVDLWKSHGFDWGGDYGGKKDAMHFEFNGTPADARRITAALRAPTPPPHVPPAPNPIPPMIIDEEEEMYLRRTTDGAIIHVYGERWRHLSGPAWNNRAFFGAKITAEGDDKFVAAFTATRLQDMS